MTGTKKKQKKTKKSTESTLKKPRASSMTQKSKLNMTKPTAMKKKDFKPSDTQQNQDASLSSSVNMKTEKKTKSVLSLHDVLKNLKKKSISNLEKEGNGFIHPTDVERDVLKKAKKQMGRPKKQDEHRKEVVSFRVSLFERNLLISWAKKHGFTNWKDCALTQAIEEENRDSKEGFWPSQL